MKTETTSALYVFALTNKTAGNLFSRFRSGGSRSVRSIKKQNSKFKNDEKTPFFKGFQSLSKKNFWLRIIRRAVKKSDMKTPEISLYFTLFHFLTLSNTFSHAQSESR